MNNQIAFKLDKKNLFRIIALLLLLFLMGNIFVFYSDEFTSSYVRNVDFIKFIGIISSLIFLPMLIGYIQLLFKKDGLIISSKGIVNNTNLTNVGFIAWKDIRMIQIKTLRKNRFVLVYLKNDSLYTKKASFFQRINMFGYRKRYGTSIIIEVKNMQCTIEEIQRALKQRGR